MARAPGVTAALPLARGLLEDQHTVLAGSQGSSKSAVTGRLEVSIRECCVEPG